MVYDSCPSLNYATYSYARRIINEKIKSSSSVKEKNKYADFLAKVYEKGRKYFPQKISYADSKINLSIVYYENKLKSNIELFEILDDAFKKDKANFDKSRGFLCYFYTAVDTYKEGKKTLQNVFGVYDNVMEKINEERDRIGKSNDKLLEKQQEGVLTGRDRKIMKFNEKTEENLDKVASSIDNKLGGLANCDKLLPLYKKNINAHKNDALWLRRAANRMEEKDCTADPIFITIVEYLHSIKSSAESAYYLGILNDRKRKYSEAIKYYNEAISLSSDATKKGKISLKVAAKLKKVGKNQKAYGYAKKALSFSPSLGEAYLLIASIYSNSANACGSNTFEKRAIYWKAASIAKKASLVKPSLKNKVRKTVLSYEKRAPSKQDIFESGMAGKTISFKCWIGGSVNVPKL
ncbi:tetratricopeptide repeat protein [Elysia marginata]|uniref:Tetratricopeptide repeat protein n=1 Tax=Elysia marginata TaxID=1093978 RepID=A0AAV4FW74_9GAST|nr:tetratricopeptide repeat protein [Elysia marginata]